MLLIGRNKEDGALNTRRLAPFESAHTKTIYTRISDIYSRSAKPHKWPPACQKLSPPGTHGRSFGSFSARLQNLEGPQLLYNAKRHPHLFLSRACLDLALCFGMSADVKSLRFRSSRMLHGRHIEDERKNETFELQSRQQQPSNLGRGLHPRLPQDLQHSRANVSTDPKKSHTEQYATRGSLKK